jgi:hypothetical protein
VSGSSGKYNVSIAYEPYGVAQTRNDVIVNGTTHTTYTYWDNPSYANVRFRATVKALAAGENDYQPRGAGATVDVYCPYASPTVTSVPSPTLSPQGTNLAKGKPLLKYEGNVNYGSQVNSWPKVNDGDINTYWLVNTNGTPRTDVVIDLGATYSLSSVAYVLLADTNYGATSPIETYVSPDNATWTKIATTTVTNSRTNVTSVPANNTKARYLRARWGDGPWNGWGEFREIMAYGTQPTATPSPAPTPLPAPAGLTATCSADNKAATLKWTAVPGHATGRYGVTVSYEPYGVGQTRITQYVNGTSHETYTYWDQPQYASITYDAAVQAVDANNRPVGIVSRVRYTCPYASPTPSAPPVMSVTASPSATLAVSPTPDCGLRPKGDADCSGVVDASDYAIWKAVFTGSQVPAVQDPDFDRSGNTTLVDLEIWTRNLGITR